jgi:16S rRNA (cytosine1402-N4)-methyltransferase
LAPVVTGYHTPVLADVVERLARDRRRVVDATVGGGGHAALFVAAGAELLAVDRDPEALAAARGRLGDDRVTYRLGSFGDPDVWSAVAAFQPDFILLDLGVSSHQLDADRRGFSFRTGVTLDMRMGPTRQTAAALLNSADEATLRELFRDYGDERRAGALARAIVERRARAPLATSDDLVGAIRRALGPRTGPPDFARLFQAVRIAVNDELASLRQALPALREALTPGGVLAVISYHSGEDRIVKDAFRDWARACRCPPGQPICTCEGRPLALRVTSKPVLPDPAEAAANPRARSARLRAVERLHGA